MTIKKPKKFYILTSTALPTGLRCEENGGDDVSENIQTGYDHKLTEVDTFGDTSKIEIDANVIFLAHLVSSDEDRMGMFEEAPFVQGMIATIHTDGEDYLFVTTNGDYVRFSQFVDKCFPVTVFHPKNFGLEPFPIWEKELGNDITPPGDLDW